MLSTQIKKENIKDRDIEFMSIKQMDDNYLQE